LNGSRFVWGNYSGGGAGKPVKTERLSAVNQVGLPRLPIADWHGRLLLNLFPNKMAMSAFCHDSFGNALPTPAALSW
jgi:hypothetical protein